jgi:ABC-type phosphate transport system substrate-binding protein
MRSIAAIFQTLALAALFTCVCFVGPSSGASTEESYKVIVHPENPVTTVDREFLRDAYLKRAVDWGHGATVRPIDLSRPSSVRDRFTHEVLKKSSSQLKNYWNQQIFSGKGVPPPAVSPERVIEYVLENPGAVGYLPSDVDPGNAKVVPVH